MHRDLGNLVNFVKYIFEVYFESGNLNVSCYTLLKKTRIENQGMATIKECSHSNRMEGRKHL